MSLSLAACVLLTVVAEPGKFAVDAAVARDVRRANGFNDPNGE